MFKSLHLVNNKKDMYMQIYDYFSNKIRFGVFKPGDKLPTYSEFINEYSVSKVTVQKAYRLLQEKGLVILSTKGTFVADQNPSTAEAIVMLFGDIIRTAKEYGTADSDILTALDTVRQRFEENGGAFS